MKFNQLDNALTFCFCRKSYLLSDFNSIYLFTHETSRTFLLCVKVIDDILFYR